MMSSCWSGAAVTTTFVTIIRFGSQATSGEGVATRATFRPSLDLTTDATPQPTLRVAARASAHAGSVFRDMPLSCGGTGVRLFPGGDVRRFGVRGETFLHR